MRKKATLIINSVLEKLAVYDECSWIDPLIDVACALSIGIPSRNSMYHLANVLIKQGDFEEEGMQFMRMAEEYSHHEGPAQKVLTDYPDKWEGESLNPSKKSPNLHPGFDALHPWGPAVMEKSHEWLLPKDDTVFGNEGERIYNPETFSGNKGNDHAYKDEYPLSTYMGMVEVDYPAASNLSCSPEEV